MCTKQPRACQLGAGANTARIQREGQPASFFTGGPLATTHGATSSPAIPAEESATGGTPAAIVGERGGNHDSGTAPHPSARSGPRPVRAGKLVPESLLLRSAVRQLRRLPRPGGSWAHGGALAPRAVRRGLLLRGDRRRESCRPRAESGPSEDKQSEGAVSPLASVRGRSALWRVAERWCTVICQLCPECAQDEGEPCRRRRGASTPGSAQKKETDELPEEEEEP